MSTATLDSPWLFDVPTDEGTGEVTPMQEMREFMVIQKEEGALITQTQAALLLGVTKVRVGELVGLGRFTMWEFLGGKYVSFKQVAEYCRSARKSGRPSKIAFLAAAVDRE